ncbi:UDP-N-acetylhexosamine pyrophosphorylase-like isoform X1 [Dreissena polymorpha]|uniref:UDP-N-acetylhexosamine pyrophosphorylase-like isoform X1 n=1 Tax=Dreissena polymorpha TaxID=45954 RepID=UPI00226429E9|nr:UDP-N-acetylhexosamine pyrophosphorylase-like isoform X1 [Dreissena polymorpha]XP_052235180.1 UDP-N-acetylhexosamine pyrophosphorylase-like isoform X1 [Dreissena polymorpha]XP_052235189.1 UDP-N-acetylhexosamine pyrophosphorylase-like isoform X1 [Dreissena polymorpha]
MDIEGLRQRLNAAGQGHLIQFWETLSDGEKQSLYNELNHMDFMEINGFFESSMQSLKHVADKLDDLLEPLPGDVFGSVTRTSSDKLDEYRTKGLTAIANNNVAVLLLAGGQGTRLGVNYPKGMYNVGLPSGKTLYQIQAERILKVQENAKVLMGKSCEVPWYIMTSEHTKEPTRQFFANHNFFGLKKENVVLFEQNLLPCIGFDGKIFLDSPGKVALAPDGNGGLYRALRKSHILKDMEQRGIQYVHVYCVDNILVKMADPVFLGFCMDKGADCGAKVVEKALPTEAVGVVCKVEGKYQVVEYSEITLRTAEKRNQDGRLTFNAGNICNHFFTLDFLNLVTDPQQESELKHHVAKKKIPYVDSAGKLIKPAEPNGIKMEKFVFDVFHFTTDRSFAVWEVLREEEFSPLKNADSAPKDTPTTCRNDLFGLHRRWVDKAGAKFTHKDGSVIPAITSSANCAGGTGDSKQTSEEFNEVVCEVSPLVSYEGEDLEAVVCGQKFLSPVRLERGGDGDVVILQGSS